MYPYLQYHKIRLLNISIVPKNKVMAIEYQIEIP
jgi:hypothetical protein